MTTLTVYEAPTVVEVVEQVTVLTVLDDDDEALDELLQDVVVVEVQVPGEQGIPGAAGEDGTPGTSGSDGLSAYEVAVDNGFVGDEAAWLASLVGPAGTGSAITTDNGLTKTGDNIQLGGPLLHDTDLPTNGKTLTVGGGTLTPTGSELIVNGTFAGDASGWALGSDATYAANAVTSTYGSGDPSLAQTFATVIGDLYKVTWDISGANASSYAAISSGPYSQEVTGDGSNVWYFTAASTSTILYFDDWNYNAGDTWTLDNVSVKSCGPAVAVKPTFQIKDYYGRVILTMSSFAGPSMTLGDSDYFNLSIGVGALPTNQGLYNCAFGWHALGANIAGGNNNCAFGLQALEHNTSAHAGAAFGQGALRQNTTGDGNTGIGFQAMRSNTTGYHNVSVGALSSQAQTTGSQNTVIGEGAGYENVSGDGNVCVGYQAGYNGVTPNATGAHNIFIGENPAPEVDGLVNAVAIGYHARVGKSNAIVMGGNYQGNWSNFGMGTTMPDDSTIMDLVSSTRGFAPPRMTTSLRDQIVAPTVGLLIYNTTTSAVNYYDGAAWQAVGGETAASILTKLLTVDGAGSGLDADTLDGISSAGFVQTSRTVNGYALTTNISLTYTDVGADASGAAATAQAAAIAAAATDATTKANAAQTAAQSYADTLVVGLVDDRGNFDASVNTFPASGGSGAAGAVLKGDLWTVSVAGTLGGVAVTAGDLVRALVDAPGQTAGNWAVTENNIGYVAENAANKVTSMSGASTNVQYPSAKAAYDADVAVQAAAASDATTKANAAQAAAVQRANHTGTQLAATISDFAATVLATVLTGLSTATNAVITASDTVLSALGKLQKQITDLTSTVSGTVIDSIADSDTTHAPSRNAVFDALALKLDTSATAGDVTLAAVGSAPSANGASLAAQVLTLQPADATHPGVVTTGAQSWAGVKAFSSSPTVPDPSAATDAVNLQTLQSYLAQLDSKDQCAYASTAALPANTYSNGSSGVGATLTGTANGPLLVDGVTMLTANLGERILVAGEAVDTHNGWYTITQIGVVALTPYILTRATPDDQAAEIGPGYMTAVKAPAGLTAGSANDGKVFLSVAPVPFVVGTSSLTFGTVGNTYTASTGLTLTGTAFSVNYGTSGTTAAVGNDSRLSDARTPVGTALTSAYLWLGNGSNVAAAVLISGDITFTNAGVAAIGAGKVTNVMLAGSIAASKLTGTDIATVGTVTAGTWNATIIGTAYGGTGVDNSTGGTANQFWARPNGATGAAAYRAIVAADIPTLNQSTTGNAATVTTNANLTGPVTSVGNATTIDPDYNTFGEMLATDYNWAMP